MLYRIGPIPEHLNGNAIKPYLPFMIDLAHVSTSSLREELHLCFCDRVFRSAMLEVAARFYFDEDENASIPCNDVDFSASPAPVTFCDAISFAFKKCYGILFAEGADVLLDGHVENSNANTNSNSRARTPKTDILSTHQPLNPSTHSPKTRNSKQRNSKFQTQTFPSSPFRKSITFTSMASTPLNCARYQEIQSPRCTR